MDEDRELIERVVAGDVESFRGLVRKYQQPLLALIRNLIANAAEQEDLAQDVFLSAFAHLSSYDHRRAPFSTWLFAIARNRCVNVLRKRKPVTLDSLPEPGDARTPHDCAAENETFRRLDSALAGLPVEQRTAFVLAEIQGLSYREICRIEGVRLGTLKSRINRAKRKLRSCLQSAVEPQ